MLPAIWKLINDHLTRETFEDAVIEEFGPDTDSHVRIMRAYDDSVEGHGGQYRYSGEEYFQHARAVAVILLCYLKVRDPNVIIAALLHDLPEDNPDEWSVRRIRDTYGTNVAVIVYAVTEPDKEDYPSRKEFLIAKFKKVIAGGLGSILVKLADSLHNALTLWGTPKKKYRKLQEVSQFIVPIAAEYDVLWTELQLAIGEQIKSRHINDEETSTVGVNGN